MIELKMLKSKYDVRYIPYLHEKGGKPVDIEFSPEDGKKWKFKGFKIYDFDYDIHLKSAIMSLYGLSSQAIEAVWNTTPLGKKPADYDLRLGNFEAKDDSGGKYKPGVLVPATKWVTKITIKDKRERPKNDPSGKYFYAVVLWFRVDNKNVLIDPPIVNIH